MAEQPASRSAGTLRHAFSYAVFVQERVHRLQEKFHDACLNAVAAGNPKYLSKAIEILHGLYSEAHGQSSPKQRQDISEAIQRAEAAPDLPTIRAAHLKINELLVRLGYHGPMRVVRGEASEDQRLINALLPIQQEGEADEEVEEEW